MDNCSCLSETIETIIKLQKASGTSCCNLQTCDRPYLGCTSQNGCCYNTRPVTFYTCPTGALWTMPYTLNNVEATSSIFRLEASDGCCCTCRVLAPNSDTTSLYPYVATDSFFTLNLKCVSALKCLDDTYVACI